jgi:hypothetical protein
MVLPPVIDGSPDNSKIGPPKNVWESIPIRLYLCQTDRIHVRFDMGVVDPCAPPYLEMACLGPIIRTGGPFIGDLSLQMLFFGLESEKLCVMRDLMLGMGERVCCERSGE